MAVDPDTLVVHPAALASAVGLSNPSQAQLDAISDAIADAQDDVAGYLNRETLIPRLVTRTDLMPLLGVDLDSYKAWREALEYDDDVEVVERVAHDDGSYDVTFKVGFDGPNKRPLVRYVKAHALRGLREDDQYGFPLKRVVNNVAADGQSLTFEPRPTSEGAPGALPTMKSLRQYRRLSVFQRGRDHGALWPNAGTRL